MTKAVLAKVAGVTVRSVTAYESGKTQPTDSTLCDLSRALNFPRSFFSSSPIEAPTHLNASFRSMSSMSASQRDAALSAGALAIEFSEWIGERFNLPTSNLPDLRGYEPSSAAEALRGLWRLGERPIKNAIHLAEANGVRVFSLAQECREVDAFSLWRGETPYVFLNTMKTAERSRFDLAHELGHLVMHRHGGPGGRDSEREADRFAGAFLMSEGSVRACAPRLPCLEHLIILKQNWNVSVAAITHRLLDLGLLSPWHYRMLCIEIGKRGYRVSEPNGIVRETSQLLHKVLVALRNEGVTKSRIAEALHVEPSDLDATIFGLVVTSLQGGGNGSDSKSREHLKLVAR